MVARSLSSAVAGACAAVLIGTMTGTANAASHNGHTWYVQAAARSGGTGSAQHPFDSLAQASKASHPNDTIVVLPSPAGDPPLNGGIALKPGQRLVGAGAEVTRQGNQAPAPRITNTSVADNNGDAVALADHTTVSNLVIQGSARGGIYGKDVTGVTIEGNDVSGQNTSCTPGFFVLPFTAPSNTPGVGGSVPAPGLSNGWAGIMVDGDQGRQTVKIANNYVHDGVCGDGIDIRANDTGEIKGQVTNNDVTRIPQGPGLRSVLAIGMQAQGESSLNVKADNNTETDIGSTGADCEGLFANLDGSSHLTETVSHNTFAHGIGGASCNGLENILSSGPATSRVEVSDSTFTDDPGDMFEEANLGTASTMTMDITRTVIAHTTIDGGNAGTIPFNLGECLTATAAGPNDRVTLRIDHSILTDCNNALSFGSNVVSQNGTGPAAKMDVAVDHSEISNSAHYDLYWHNLTAINALSIKVDHTTLAAGHDAAVALLQDPGATTKTANIQLGDHNNIINNKVDILADAYRINAQQDWWGNTTGPTTSQLRLTPPASLHDQPVLHAPA